MKTELRASVKQRGAVLLVSLMLLLVTTFIGFSAMETSNLEGKMSTARQLKELTFQTAETAIELSLNDNSYPGNSYAISLASSTNWPTRAYTFTHDSYITASSIMRFISDDIPEGYSLRKGGSNMGIYSYEVESTATRANTNISSTHIQGIYVEGAKLN